MVRAGPRDAGFTLIEVLIALGIIGLLAGLTFINLGKPQTTATLTSTVSGLMADIKAQQQLAMTGDDGGSGSQAEHGIVFTTSDYTLFAGNTFNSGDSNNFTVAPGSNVTLNADLPSTTLQFAKSSGEVVGFDASHDTITVTVDDANTVITINRFGTVTAN
ncbi:MAG TPA: type II secretion system protein [Patescibacteria group bacterium]|nr:type II secretion system protein [Patescibacteria group bacterium]